VPITDEYRKDIPPAPSFHDFLQRQGTLQATAYNRSPAAMAGEDRVEFVRWNVLAGAKELMEMLDEVAGWKPWDTVHRGANAGSIDRDKFIEEGVDVLHFVANLLLTVGCTDRELSEVYVAKQRTNRERQEVGYAGKGADHPLAA